MENNELQKLWENIDTAMGHVSKSELNRVLRDKVKKTVRKYLYIIGLSVTISAGVIIFLIITALNRPGDELYLLNNMVLGILTLTALVISVKAWIKLQNQNTGQSLKEWLNAQIKQLTEGLTGKHSKLYVITIPVFFILLLLSIHVYFENMLFSEVLRNEESITGMVIAIPIGLFVSYQVHKAIRAYQKKQLEYLYEIQKKLD